MISHHLGCPPDGDKPAEADNHRNGSTGKTVLTEDGPLRVEVPRDREGSFEPLLIPKHERCFTGIDETIVAMYARGMTVRAIQDFLSDQYGTQLSPEFIGSVTDAVMAEVAGVSCLDRRPRKLSSTTEVTAWLIHASRARCHARHARPITPPVRASSAG